MDRETRPKTIVSIQPLWSEATNNIVCIIVWFIVAILYSTITSYVQLCCSHHKWDCGLLIGSGSIHSLGSESHDSIISNIIYFSTSEWCWLWIIWHWVIFDCNFYLWLLAYVSFSNTIKNVYPWLGGLMHMSTGETPGDGVKPILANSIREVKFSWSCNWTWETLIQSAKCHAIEQIQIKNTYRMSSHSYHVPRFDNWKHTQNRSNPNWHLVSLLFMVFLCFIYFMFYPYQALPNTNTFQIQFPTILLNIINIAFHI